MASLSGLLVAKVKTGNYSNIGPAKIFREVGLIDARLPSSHPLRVERQTSYAIWSTDNVMKTICFLFGSLH